MKTLKGFVRQKARPEGSMSKGWLVQESMVYITKFLASIDPNMPLQWHNKEDEHIVGEVAQREGTHRKMSMLLREKIMKFCYLNSNDMQKWVERYEDANQVRTMARQRFRVLNKGRFSLPDPAHLARDMLHA